MSIFDPYSLYKNRQKQSKKGQVIQKKPITNVKAYNKRDLEEAYRVLNAYGIPYGEVPPPPTPPPPTVTRSSTFESYTYADTMLWDKNQVGATLSLTNKPLMDMFWEQSGLGNWVATDLDLSKVQDYKCTITSGTIMYYYDVDDQSQTGDIYYSLPIKTEDRASTYSVTLNLPTQDPIPTYAPSNRIWKTITSYVNSDPQYFLQLSTYDTATGQVQYWNQTATKDYTGAIYHEVTNNTMDIEDFVSGNYIPTTLASTYTTGTFTRDTSAVIATQFEIYFTISYTD